MSKTLGPREPLTPSMAFPSLDGATVGDFWRWAYSNLHENTVRPVLAEYIVGTLLGVERTLRSPWASYDLELEGRGIEVKSSAYLQAWYQSQPSTIQFDIAPKRAWDATTGKAAPVASRSAAVYVFALWPELDREVSPLEVARWHFWVVSTTKLNAEFGTQKSLRLARLQAVAPIVRDRELCAAVLAALAEGPR